MGRAEAKEQVGFERLRRGRLLRSLVLIAGVLWPTRSYERIRHPLRLPIPHTAIIPRKKDQIGASLGTFVQENFLTEQVVGTKPAGGDVDEEPVAER